MSSSEKKLAHVWWIVPVLAIAGLMVWGGLSQDDSSGESGDPSATSESDAGGSELARRSPDDPYALGDVDAPVVMIMYEDYRCPFCAKFATEVQPKLVDEYVDAGKLRLEWRDMTIFGVESEKVAVAARAAAQQGKFWEFNQEAYSLGDGKTKTSFPEETINQIAKDVGVSDMDQFAKDREDPKLQEQLDADFAEGSEIGVSSTPAFLINSTPVLGAQPLDTFTETIEAELDQS